MSKIDEKRLWIIEARDGAWGANGICKGELVRCKECKYFDGDQCCDKIGILVIDAELFYCADGERKDGGRDGDTYIITSD